MIIALSNELPHVQLASPAHFDGAGITRTGEKCLFDDEHERDPLRLMGGTALEKVKRDSVDTYSRRFYIPAMLRVGLAVVAALLGIMATGCDSSPKLARGAEFGPAKVRIHPTFTQIKDWTGDGKRDGIEAVVELLDSFDEPIRGSGTFLFELSEFRDRQPQPAGRRIGEPWIMPLLTRQQQDAHWSPALRAYTFQLPVPRIDISVRYVLDVSFETPGGADKPGGGRLFDRIVLEPPPGKLKSGGSVHRGTGEHGRR